MKRLRYIFLFLVIISISDLFLWTNSYAAQDTLNFGVFPRRNAKTTYELFTPIANYLNRELGITVILITPKDFNSFWSGVKNKEYDLVHYNQYHYIKSHKNYGYEVILKNEEFGASTIAGTVTIRKDGGVNNIQDLKGKKIVFGGGPKAMMSYIVPTYLLKRAGLAKTDYVEVFAKNPPNAVLSVYFNQFDAAGAGDVVLKLGIVKKHINTNQMTHLVTSEQIAHLPWAVNPDLENSLKTKIQNILLKLNDSERGMAILNNAKLSGIHKANDAEYNPHRKIINTVFGNSN